MQATEVVTAPPPGVGTTSKRSAASTRERQSMNRTAQLICAGMGPVMVVLFGIGSVWLAKYFPPHIRANWDAQKTANFYAEHKDKIRIGLVFTCMAYGVMATYGVAMASQTRRKEGMFPTLTYVQLVNMAAGTAQIVVMVALWATAAYRPGSIDPQITQGFNDAGWLLLMGTWITFTIWSISVGLAVLLDKSDTPVFPRWSGWLSVWAGIGYIPGSGVWFAKHGAMDWNGAIALYYVFIIFGVWVLTFSWLSYKNVKAGYVHEQEI